MKFCPTSAIVAIGLMFSVLPGHAQLTYARVSVPTTEMASTDPETEPIAITYKVVHGVVQGHHL